MKILQVYKDYYPPVKGGIECHINLLANGLKNKGVDVQVLVSNTLNKYKVDIHNGIKIFKAPQLERLYSAPLTPTFSYYLRKLGKTADIIHFHYPNPTAELSYFLTNLEKKLIVTYHSDIIRQDRLGKLYSPFRKLFLELSDKIIATSPNYIDSSNVLKELKHKCTVIPLGIDIDRFIQSDNFLEINRIKREHGGKPLILFVGCFRYYKGLHYLILAMKNIDAMLVLIGTGPEEQKLRRIVDYNKLNEKICFLGELPNDSVDAYYNACDIFVLPSNLRSEAFGMVQLEAMCCGKPVVSTELGTGTSFVNVNNETGIVVKPNNVKSLSNALNYLIDNPKKRIQFGKCGSNRVKQLFTAKGMVDNTLRLYKEVIRENKKNPINKLSVKRLCDKDRQKKIKILRIVSRLNIGGPAIHCAILTKGLSRKRFKSKLLTGRLSKHEGDMSYLLKSVNDGTLLNVPEMQREINLKKDIIALFKIIRIIFTEKPDIIHTHMAKAGAISRIAVFVHNLIKRKKIKTVHTFHGNVLDGYFNPLRSRFFSKIEKALAKVTDAIIAISQTQKWELTEKYKLTNDNKVHIINLGFDLTHFLNNKGKGLLRSFLKIGKETLLIGIVGRLVPIKNHTLFMDSAKIIKEKFLNKDIKFVIVGDGELRDELEIYAQKIGLRENVVFYGWEKEIERIYADIDILLLTSNNEGTPVSIIESMASSVPVVTTGVGGVKDLLGSIIGSSSNNKDGYSICERGILCPKGNAESLACGVQYLIENDCYRIVSKARDFVFKNYTDDRLIERIRNLYENLV